MFFDLLGGPISWYVVLKNIFLIGRIQLPAIFFSQRFQIYSILDQTLKYSPLGIASGFLWVIGGTCGIFAVRNAGLALSVGIWSSVIVLVRTKYSLFFIMVFLFVPFC